MSKNNYCVFHRICIQKWTRDICSPKHQNPSFEKKKKKKFQREFFLQISSKDKAWNLMYLLHYVTCIVIPKNSRQWFSGRCWQSFHVIRSELLKIWNISDCGGVRDFRKKSFKIPICNSSASFNPTLSYYFIPQPALRKYLLNCNTNFLNLVSATTLRMSYYCYFMLV